MTQPDHLRAALRLHLVEGVGALMFRRLLEAFGSAEGVLAAGPGQWRRVQGVGAKLCRAIQAVTEGDVDAELAEAASRGVTVLCLDDAAYPAALKRIHDPPPVLYVLGGVEACDAVAVGVVGARRCTHYGLEQAERFGELLARAGFTVVSGGARGIDAAAHRGALAAGGRTLAVMGCGLCRTYPRENADLFEQVRGDGNGAVLAEMPMRTGVRAGNFHSRNRIIAGLSLGVLVIEAAQRSGALITAGQAVDEGRDVFALPGRVDSPVSWGSNELIRQGKAALVRDLDDILDELGDVGRLMTPPEPSGRERIEAAGLDGRERKLVEALREGALGIDELVRRTGLDSGRAAACLTVLMLKGAVAQKPGQVYALRSFGGGSSGAP